ncbi:twin-arginine translocase subunit TatC [Parachitinimonas caeni]|uniref:Sec-independent protein translocase protein TatC n=1 Tax=Parachitinimonas caeni TaxID=3031301 RepID=A0ABT7DSU2_9NEIS|nr:twin-arginine translocase subunit TatC [Parachitinimonas caeni]MDK2123139.1 twin-arginine translocase subunit TatC [Parachitinimonas caeni]
MQEELQPLIVHLIELRQRLLRSVVVLAVVFFSLIAWSNDIFHLLALPLLKALKALPVQGEMIATEVTTPFFVPMKVTAMVAFIITLPHTLYQAWSFVAPGLYQHEKRFALPVLASSVVLFIVGMAFAYFLVFPVVFGFMTTSAPQGVKMSTDIDKYVSFVLGMFLAFGCTFEVPVVVVLLAKMGFVSVTKLREARPYVIVGAFVIAAIVTPPDVLSQVMLAVPLWVLYEVGLLIARVWIASPEKDLVEPNT